MENETPEFETPSTPNKDMWLFLIVLDAIILCVLGFFLYNHFSSRIFRPVVKPAVTVTTETVEIVEGTSAIHTDSQVPLAISKYQEGIEAFDQEDWSKAKQLWLEAQKLDPSNPDIQLALSKVEEILAKSVAQPEEKQMAAEPVQEITPQPVVEEEPIALENPEVVTPAKQSVIVTPVNGSKYRRVIFRWFDPAEKVSIVSGFTNRKPQPLKKIGDYWETTLSIAPGTYKFLYIIDGKNTLDPYSDQKDGRSVLVVK